MKKLSVNHITIALSLLSSLFVYLFYRSEQTVVNEIFKFVFSGDVYFNLKAIISENIILPQFLVFSLPEGLWVLAVTLASKNIYFGRQKHLIHVAILPIIISVTLELFQLISITNGTFDWLDITSAICFWGIGYFLLPSPSNNQRLFVKMNVNSVICLASYMVLYLSHVSA
ncbi:MAG: hypothetical protein ACJAV5_000630 [Vicingaceae bacterium]